MSPIGALQNRHAPCGCLTGNSANGIIRKHGCRLTIDGLRVATDCDRCAAFGEDEKRPDIIAIQCCDSNDDYRWLVIEIKGVMDTDARKQAQAGLNAIGGDELFGLSVKRARVCFAFKTRDLRRAADRQQLRKPFKWGESTVPVLVRRCDSTIPRRWQ